MYLLIIVTFASEHSNVVVTHCNLHNLCSTGFVAFKKLEAVCRSMPSMILQLYTLLDTLNVISDANLYLLTVSVVLSAAGSSATLSQLHPKTTINIFTISYWAIHCYYISEVIVRISSLAMIFVSLKYYASIPVGLEFIYRVFKISNKEQGLLRVDYSMAILWMGSDDSIHQHDMWLVGTLLTTMEIFVFSFVVNFADTSVLNVMRDLGVTRVITCLTWTAFALKLGLHYVIQKLPNQSHDLQDDEDILGDEVVSKLQEKGMDADTSNNSGNNPYLGSSDQA